MIINVITVKNIDTFVNGSLPNIASAYPESVLCCSPWCCTENDTQLSHHHLPLLLLINHDKRRGALMSSEFYSPEAAAVM